MLNVVLYEPEIPANTGNIMRTCVATDTKLHLIKPLGFSLEDKYVKRSGVNYIDKCDYTVYENIYFFFGKESTGIPLDILKDHLDNCMRIPMTSNVRALNVSNSVAVMVYEALRQLDFNDLLRYEPHKDKNIIKNYEK